MKRFGQMFCCFSKPHIENFFCQWSIISSCFPNSVKNGIDRLYTHPILRFDHINLLSLNNTIYVGNFYYLENNWRAHFAESRHLWVHTFKHRNICLQRHDLSIFNVIFQLHVHWVIPNTHTGIWIFASVLSRIWWRIQWHHPPVSKMAGIWLDWIHR